MGLILIRISFPKSPNGFLQKREEFVKNGRQLGQISGCWKIIEKCADRMHCKDFILCLYI